MLFSCNYISYSVSWKLRFLEVGDRRMNSTEKKHQEDLRRIKEFRLLDDDFMTKCFENNKECTELVLHILMNQDDLKVQDVCTQYGIKNLQGRSVRLDIYATDKQGKRYNIEIQRSDRGAGAKRARYNSSLIDANSLISGEDVEDLPETFVIFITEHDVLGDNKPIYHINRCISETGKMFGDGSHILYVNAECRDDTPLGRLMSDFSCTNPADMHYTELAERARYFKEDEEGVALMCKAIEEMRAEERMEEKMETAMRMLNDGTLSMEKIAEYTGLSIDEVNDIKRRKAV